MVNRLLRVAALSVLVIAAAGVGIFLLGKITPTGFLPEEDQGAIFTVVQLPDGASVERTRNVVEQVENLIRPMPQVEAVLSIVGFSLLDGGNQPNAAFLVTRLKPFEDRAGAANGVRAVLGQIFGAAQQIRSAIVFPFNLPPIIGLSTSGGFEYQLENLEGRPPEDMASVMQGMVAAANQDPRLNRVFSTFTASNPSIWLDIDREKAQALGLCDLGRVQRAADHARRLLRQRFQPVRPHLAGQYPGRCDRSERSGGDLQDLCPQQDAARWCRCGRSPMSASSWVRRSSAGTTTTAAVTINGSPKPGVSSGDALVAMDQLSRTTLPPGYNFEWTGTAYQEREASGQTGYILALAVLFAYLFLVALYESWMIPIPVLLSVTVGVLGAFFGLQISGSAAGSVCADRHGGADRAGGEERHPDRRVRQGAAGGRAADPGSGGAGGADANPSGADDVDRVHLRPDPAGLGGWARRC